ncbi:MAG: hypothetical protein U0354_05605 [Candidatus Sericytochromatia bacterium]
MKKILIILFIISIPLNSYSNEEEFKYNEQWKTVQQLQRIIDNNILKEAPSLFSKRFKDKIKFIIEKDPNFFKTVWGLNEFRLRIYKEQVFKGRGIFIFEDNQWKIDEL